MTTLPNSGGTELTSGQAVPETRINDTTRRLDAGFCRSQIEDRDLATPPGTCADGARYLVATSPTGAWSGQAGKLAVALGTNAANGWDFITVAVEGFDLYVRDENIEIRYNGSAWVALDASLALDDLTDVDTTGVATNDVLTWDGADWVAAPAPGSGGGSGGTVPSGGAAGTVLRKDTGTDYDTSWGYPGPIATYTGTAAAQVDVALPSGYVRHRLVIAILPATSGVEIRCRITDDNFSTVESGASDYYYNDFRVWPGTNTGNSGSNAADHIRLASANGNTLARSFIGTFDVLFAADSAWPTDVQQQHNRINGSGDSSCAFGGGRYLTASAVNGLRIYASSGNIDYTIYVYGDPTS